MLARRLRDPAEPELAPRDEACERARVDEGVRAEHAQRGAAPEAVARVGGLARAPAEPAVGALLLHEPPHGVCALGGGEAGGWGRWWWWWWWWW